MIPHSMIQSQKHSKEVVYAFIDSQNLNLGTNKDVVRHGKTIYRGWSLDFSKFKRFLTDKFRVSKSFLFIGYIDTNEKLYKHLLSLGYVLVYKPTVSDQAGKPKGNVDAELVLHASAVELANFDKAVIVSGDGDFRCLLEFLRDRGKLKSIVIPNSHTVSSLLKDFEEHKVFLNREQKKLEHRDKKVGGVARKHST